MDTVTKLPPDTPPPDVATRDLDIGVRVYHRLLNSDPIDRESVGPLDTLAKIVAQPLDYLWNIPGFGQKSMNELEGALSDHGYEPFSNGWRRRPPMKVSYRTVRAISAGGRELYALADDGTLWVLEAGSGLWERVVSLPPNVERTK
jgi:hypothetical protein